MALDFMRVLKGFAIEGGIEIFNGTVDPSAGGGVAAPIGSIYCETDSGDIWHKTGAGDTAWTKFLDSAGASTEDGYQNAYTGKTAVGSELPVYTEDNHVADDDTLVAAIDKLDMYLGAGVAVPAVRTTGPITELGDVNENIGALDTAIGADLTPETRTNNPTVAANDLNENISALDKAIGDDADLGTPTYVTVDSTVNAKIAALDTAIAGVIFGKTETNKDASSGYAVDTVAHADVDGVEYLLTVRENAAPTKIYTMKILVTHDGTIADFTVYGLIKRSTIAAFDVTAAISGANLVLTVTATNAIDYVLKRIVTAF